MDGQGCESTKPLVGSDQRGERSVDEDVPVKHEERPRQKVREGVSNAPGRAQEALFTDAYEFQHPVVPGDERLDLVSEVVGIDHDALDTLPLKVPEMPGEERLSPNLEEHLGDTLAEVPETSPAPRCENHRVHDLPSV